MTRVRCFVALSLTLFLTACAAGPDPAPPHSGSAHEHETYPLPADLVERRGEEATLAGYMVPLRFDESDRVVEFMLATRPLQCCETEPPAPDEWVHVAMAEGRSAPYVGSEPVTVRGTLLASLPRDIAEGGGLHALEGVSVTPR